MIPKNLTIPAALLLTILTATSPADLPATTATASAPAPLLRLSEIRESSLDNNLKDGKVSFAQGIILSYPFLKANASPEEKKEHAKYIADNKIDGIVYTSEPDFGISLTTGPGTAFLKVDSTAWDKLTPDQIEKLLKLPEAQKDAGALSDTSTPVTFIFRSIHGTIGIAQLIGFSNGEKNSATLKSKILTPTTP